MYYIPSIKKHFQETSQISNCLIFFADQPQFLQKKFLKNTFKFQTYGIKRFLIWLVKNKHLIFSYLRVNKFDSQGRKHSI